MGKLFYVLFALYRVISAISADNDPFLIESKRLPSDLNFMPTLGNGQLGFTIYGDAIFVNGLYNGHGGDSRRARIPNWLNLTLSTPTAPTADDDDDRTYQLLLDDGYFRTTSKAGGLRVEERIYAHRYFTRALVYELRVQRPDPGVSLDFFLELSPGDPSEALDFEDHGPGMLKGLTRQVELEKFQPKPRVIFVAFSDDFRKERKYLQLREGERELYFRYVLTIDESEEVARKEMQQVLALNSSALMELHTTEWRRFWNQFNIEVDGELELSRTINAGIFYLASSLPSPTTHQPDGPYFGLSPTGLGRGNLDADYEGHNFWDTEIWMLPVVTQLDHAWTKQLFRYRRQHLPGAEYNARQTGYQGARFPWESAFTGTEVTNPCCPEVAEQEIHISADIAFALQQFFATTGDREWLCEDAWPLLAEIAAFLASRVAVDDATGDYHVKDVMGPDEDHYNVTDNVYTNVVFKLALEFTSFAQSICSPNAPQPTSWHQISERLVVLYDPQRDYHPQHEGYEPNEQIKQADVVLVGYPLQFPMNLSTRANDLHTYEKVTRASGPAMTWSMFAINYLDVSDVKKAEYYFEKSYQDYVRPEFKVWSETPIGFEGSANFLTGIGGFLQAVIAGYGGVRFHTKNSTNSMQILGTHLLPKTNSFTIRGLKFANATFDLNVNQAISTLLCTEIGKYNLEVVKGEERIRLFKGSKVEFTETVVVNFL